ncbi:hypothetical protein F9Z36_1868 [Neisseria gonorrhoeae]|nr:hypothetical protein F9Z36_1868 [Neisseria gonorrhoeae]
MSDFSGYCQLPRQKDFLNTHSVEELETKFDEAGIVI